MGPSDFLIDLLDVLLVSWLFYRLFLIFRQTKAIRILTGIGVLSLVFVVARLAHFEAMLGLVDAVSGKRLEVAVILLVLLFADEIKDTFAGITWSLSESAGSTSGEQVVEQLSRACSSMASKHTGALIAIARENPLDHWEIADSVPIDAQLTAELLETIFDGKTPLHDGAVIVRRGRIVAAKCQLPPSNSPAITRRSVGMRHRAAFGLSERSDAVILVVSEERGQIGIAHKGEFHAPVDPEELPRVLADKLRIRAERKPWYHPRRLFANAGLKALAIGLAAVLWMEQETEFELKDRVAVFERVDPDRGSGGDSRIRPRLTSLTQDELVITEPACQLVPIQSGPEARYGQVVKWQPTRYTLRGKNRARLLLLPQLLQVWRTDWGRIPEHLVGSLGFVFPEAKEDAVGLGAVIECPMVHTSREFTLVKADPVFVKVDKLVALEPSVTVEFTGKPAEGLKLLAKSPLRVPLDRDRGLIVPMRERVRVERRLNPCATRPPISIEGRREYDRMVKLEVPDVVKRWNPKLKLDIKPPLIFMEKKLALDAQAQLFNETERRDLEALSKKANERSLEAQQGWLSFQKKLEDATWDQGLTLESYESIVSKTLPDLEKRLEKAQRDLEAIERLYAAEAQRERVAEKDVERELAKARRQVCELVLGWRKEIHDALKLELESWQRRAKAIEERLKPQFDALAAAQKSKDEIAKAARPTLPELPKEAGLAAVVTPQGPKTTNAEDLSRAFVAGAASKPLLDLFSRSLKDFERWYEAARDAETLSQAIATLDSQVITAKAPIRLELQKREKTLLRDARQLTIERYRSEWTLIRPQLPDAGKIVARGNTLLAPVVESWDRPAVGRLESQRIFDLHRDLMLEVPQLLAGRTLFSEQLDRVEDPQLRQEAREASRIWWGHQRRLHDRILRVCQVLGRRAGLDPDSSLLTGFESTGRTLERLRDRVVAEEEQLWSLRAGGVPKGLSLLELLTEGLEVSTAAIKSQLPIVSALEARVEREEKRLSDLRARNDNLDRVAFDYSEAKTRLYQAQEHQLLLGLRRKLLEETLGLVESGLKSRVEDLRARVLAGERRSIDTLPPLIALRKSVEDRRQELGRWDRLDDKLAGIAKIDSSDSSFGALIAETLNARGPERLGFDDYVKVGEALAALEVELGARQDDLKRESELIASFKATSTKAFELLCREVALQRTRAATLAASLADFQRLFEADRGAVAERLVSAVEKYPAAISVLSLPALQRRLAQIERNLEQTRGEAKSASTAAAKESDVKRRKQLRAKERLLSLHLRHLETLRTGVRRLVKLKMAQNAGRAPDKGPKKSGSGSRDEAAKPTPPATPG